ncbi:MspA family porin [Gordonia sp. FQ]|uniref:MspA family porin n=1 Tax=Gordonia sp. FQ TaxID=3446634 RepID=UPI003F870A46
MNKFNKRLVGAAAVGAAAVVGLSSMSVGSASATPVPGGTATKKLVDGTPVTIKLFDQHAAVQRAVTNVPSSREVWVSGKVRVTVGGAAEGGSIKVGYDVGCQVNFGGVDVDTPRIGGTLDSSGPSITSPGSDSSLRGKVTLGPGQVKRVWLINDTDDDDDAVSSYSFAGGNGGVVYGQEAFRVESCAGYASARPVISVTVNTDSVKGIVTYTGRPFTMG